MRRERAARIRPGSKHNHGPEAAQFCEVSGPIVNVGVKYRPQQVVGPNPFVEVLRRPAEQCRRARGQTSPIARYNPVFLLRSELRHDLECLGQGLARALRRLDADAIKETTMIDRNANPGHRMPG